MCVCVCHMFVCDTCLCVSHVCVCHMFVCVCPSRCPPTHPNHALTRSHDDVFSPQDDVDVLKDIEQFYSTSIEEMPANVGDYL